MLIRKLFRFENAHIVRGCTSRRCARSLHGHSYRVELLLEAHALDRWSTTSACSRAACAS